MMKKKTIALLVSVAIIFLLGIILWKVNSVNMDFAQQGELIFIYGDSNINKTLSAEELKVLTDMFEGKLLYNDSPSCEFSEEIAVKINDSQTFCFAQDTCPVIYWMEKDKYFRITEKQKEQLYEYLWKCGFVFPCL